MTFNQPRPVHAEPVQNLGLGFAFAGHFSPEDPAKPMTTYRQHFRPGRCETPHAILAMAVFCADEEESARAMAASVLHSYREFAFGRADRLATPAEALEHFRSPGEYAAVARLRASQIVGTPAQVKPVIDAHMARTRADELMVATHAHDPSARLRSYELLASLYA